MTSKTKTYPYILTYEGRSYYRTGKTGERVDTGKPVIEMQAPNAGRIWVDANGTVYPG